MTILVYESCMAVHTCVCITMLWFSWACETLLYWHQHSTLITTMPCEASAECKLNSPSSMIIIYRLVELSYMKLLKEVTCRQYRDSLILLSIPTAKQRRCVYVKIVYLLLKIFNAQDGDTALHIAARKGHTDVVHVLIRSQALLDIQDEVMMTVD